MPSARPDVVLVVVDTLRADRTGLLTPGLMPEMAALAERGVAYSTAVAPSSWTLPSIAALFSGREITARRTSAYHDPTLAERFAEAGYRTVGLVANPLLTDDNGFSRGFDEFDVAPATTTSKRLADASMLPELRRWDAAALVSRAVRVLDDASRAQPVFLYVHLMDPHLPYDPAHVPRAEAIEGWSTSELPVVWRDEPLAGTEAKIAGTLRRAYDGQVAFVDEALGRLGRMVVDGRPLPRNGDTPPARRPWLMAVTSDHGEGLFSHRRNPDSPSSGEVLDEAYLEHGEQVYEEAVRVPLWLLGAGVPAQRRETRPVAMTTLGATLAHLAALDELPPGGVLPLASTDPAPATIFGTGTRDWFARTPDAKYIAPFEERLTHPDVDNRLLEVASERYLPEIESRPHASGDANLPSSFLIWRAANITPSDVTDPATYERLKRLGYLK